MDRQVSILIPVLGRPSQVHSVADSIRGTTPNAEIVFAINPRDPAESACRAVGQQVLTIERQPTGDYARKINAMFNATDRPWVFLGATDLRFHRGWLRKALTVAERQRAGVVGTNDLGNPRVLAGEHSTHSLVSRAYVDQYGTLDEPGKVLHEGYVHEFVDDEFVGTAILRGQFAMALGSIVEHMHPYFRKAESDASYRDAQRRTTASLPLFTKRKKLWTR